MAARRLLIVMLLLLGISTLAAALVPPPDRTADTERSTSTRSAPARERTEGERVAAEVPARTGARPDAVRVSAGDQLALVVQVARPAEVAVPAFGLIEFAEPGAPARFDILIDETGRFEVTAEGAGSVAMVVAERPRRQP